ncbi:MAG: hypothetical protein QM401_07240 [Bacillota bacterium]|nr:hypothetical protein [Bacillota bacterium]
MNKRKNQVWTTEEVRNLRRFHKKSQDLLLEMFPNRTWRAIVSKINRLGLKRGWTDADVSKLKEIYATSPWEVILKAFPDKNRKAIATKAERLGLRRTERFPTETAWTLSENKILKKLYPNENKSKILRRLPGRTWTAVVVRAGKLGVPRKRWFFEIDKDMLYQKYFIKDWNIRQCEQFFGCSNQAILFRLQEWFPEEYAKKLARVGRKYTLQAINDTVRDAGYELVSCSSQEEWVRTNDTIVVACPNREHAPYEVMINSFLTGRRCRLCYFSGNTGEKNPAYNASLSAEDRIEGRFIDGYKEWRTLVYEKDDFTCQMCGDKAGGNLVWKRSYVA